MSPLPMRAARAAALALLAAAAAGAQSFEEHLAAGANYPWREYGADFGSNAWEDPASPRGAAARKEEIAADLARLRGLGVRTVRWFLFADGRSSPEFDAAGRVAGLDEAFYRDFDAALEAAASAGVKLVPVLLDFHIFDEKFVSGGVQTGGRSALVLDPEVQDSFFVNALGPLFRRYGRHPAIFAWDIANEPEVRMSGMGHWWMGGTGAVDAQAMRAFVGRAAALVHAMTGHRATLGSVTRSDTRFWLGTGLDFYQYHYYEFMFLTDPFDRPYAGLGLDKPCVLGEFPTKGAERTVEEYVAVSRRNGYAGAWPWSLRGGDEHSGLGEVGERFKAALGAR